MDLSGTLNWVAPMLLAVSEDLVDQFSSLLRTDEYAHVKKQLDESEKQHLDKLSQAHCLSGRDLYWDISTDEETDYSSEEEDQHSTDGSSSSFSVGSTLRSLRVDLRNARYQVGPLEATQTLNMDNFHHVAYRTALERLGLKLFELAVISSSSRQRKYLKDSLTCLLEVEGRTPDRGTNGTISGAIAVTLLRLNRLQDLAAYILFWCQTTSYGAQQLTPQQKAMASSGRFPYRTSLTLHKLRALSIRPHFFANLVQTNSPHSLYFLTCWWLLQSKLHQDEVNMLESMQDMQRMTGHQLDQVSSILDEFAVGNAEYQQYQAHSTRQLVDLIDQRNPTLLPALLYPKPLLEENESLGCDYTEDWIFPRCPREAYFVWKAVESDVPPVALQTLENIFGSSSDLVYHASPFDDEGPAAERRTDDWEVQNTPRGLDEERVDDGQNDHRRGHEQEPPAVAVIQDEHLNEVNLNEVTV